MVALLGMPINMLPHAVSRSSSCAGAQEGETIANFDADGIEEAAEGRVITALHRRYERNSALIEAQKRRVVATLGRLACEACGFDFRERYGERGDGFIECHRTKPVHTFRPGEKTRAGDLCLLCANCHRMIHAKRRWLMIEELAAILRRLQSYLSEALPAENLGYRTE